MLRTFKNGQASIILRVKLLDSSSTTGAGLTGLTSASSGLIISTIADIEATATVYTVSGSTVETITTLGTYAAPTATKCRFKEVDATNHKGIYELQFADARFAVASAKGLLVSIAGATNLQQTDFIIQLQSFDPYVGIAQTGDNYIRLGAPAAASVSADLLAIDNLVDDLEARLTATRAGYLDNLNEVTAARMATLTDWINGGRLDLILDIIAADTTTDIPAKLLKYVQLLARSDAAIGTDNATEKTAINANGGSGAGTFNQATDALEAATDNAVMLISNTDELEARIGTPTNLGSGATLSANNVDIENQTDDIGVAGVGLTNLGGMSTTMKAQVETEANDALVANHLDHLLAVEYDPAAKPGVATALLNELVESDAGVARYTANALEQSPAGTSAAAIADEVQTRTIAGVTLVATTTNVTNAPTAGDLTATMKTSAQTAADAALVAQNLDHLLKVAAVAGDAVDNSVIARLASKSSTPSFASFVNTTDALEALRDNEGTAGAGFTALGDARIAKLDEVTAARMATLTDWINGGRLDLILDIIAEDTTTDLPARLPASLTAAGSMKVDVLAIDGDTTSANKLKAHALGVLKVVVGAGSTTTAVVLDSTTGIDGGVPSATNDLFTGRVIVFTSGALAGSTASITDYVGATKTLTVSALTSAPVSAVTGVIV